MCRWEEILEQGLSNLKQADRAMGKYRNKFVLVSLVIIFLFGCESEEDIFSSDQVQFRSRLTSSDGSSISGARVAIWANDRLYRDTSDSDGFYTILAPLREFPTSGFISLSVYGEGFRPAAATYGTPLNGGERYTIGGGTRALERCPDCLTITNDSSGRAHGLWHLGDDSFTGSQNSQFQKSSDSRTGLVFQFNEPFNASQITVTFIAKGINAESCSSVINYASNSDLLDQRILQSSPVDGSYRIQRYVFSASGGTGIGIIPGQCNNSDIDDFEFTRITIEAE